MIRHVLLMHFLLFGTPGVNHGVEYGAEHGNKHGNEKNLLKTRNPFEFGGKKKVSRKIKTSKKDKIVGMIMIKGNQKTAVINGKNYRVGDRFGKFLITSITLNYLELSSGKTTKRLYLK